MGAYTPRVMGYSRLNYVQLWAIAQEILYPFKVFYCVCLVKPLQYLDKAASFSNIDAFFLIPYI